MGAMSMFENLPLGFRFKPTDVELIDHYLRLKINGKHGEVGCIKEVDICRVEPWDLPDLSAIKTYDHEWFFFCPRDRKYPNGQRSNRATEAGYWKATGKDRTIKSRKMGLIGMKKTLVFYTGRAPKGQRTHWVIHEYRTTLQELDGTHPGQGAFVLCRLFKKADDVKPEDNDDGSNTDEVETHVLSPNQTNISQEDMRSEPAVVQASPGSVEQTVEQQVISENCVVKTSDSITSEALMPDHSHSYSYDQIRRESQMNEDMAHEVDSRINNANMYFHAAHEADSRFNPAIKYYHDIALESPTFQQLHVNQGTVGMDPFSATDIGDGHTGLQLQEINGRDPIIDFLDSVLINPDEYLCMEAGARGPVLIESDKWKTPDAVDLQKASVNESGSCSGSDVEVAQEQHEVGFLGCVTPKGNEQPVQNYAYTDDDDIFSDAALDIFCNVPNVGGQYIASGPAAVPSFVKAERGYQNVASTIQIRPNPRRGLQTPNYAPQGSAPRRIRLLAPSEAPVCEAAVKEPQSIVIERSCVSTDIDEGSSSDMDSSTIAADEDAISLAEVSENPDAAVERELSRSDGEVAGTGIKIRTHHQRSQATSTRLSYVEQGTASRRIRLQKTFRSCDEEDNNAKPLVAEAAADKTRADESDQKPSSYKSSTSVLAKRVRWRSLLPMQMIKVVMVVFFFMACIGVWKARNHILLPS